MQSFVKFMADDGFIFIFVQKKKYFSKYWEAMLLNVVIFYI